MRTPGPPARIPNKTTVSAAILLLCLFLQVGCKSLSLTDIPTRVPRAVPPIVIPTAFHAAQTVHVPATFTPEARGPLLAGAVTRLATPTLAPTASPTSSPTPELLPVAFTNPSGALYQDDPAVSTPCGVTGLVYRSRFPSAVGGPWRDYHVYLPPCYGRDGRAYPVVYLIHGSIQSDTHWLDLGLAAYADAGIAGGRYPPFIAIMPYSGQLGNITSGGPNSIEGITIDYLLPYIDRVYCTWQGGSGRTIGGISRGGYWALEIAFRHPERFSAVAGHSSHLRLETDPARYNPLLTYAQTDLSSLRIWLDWGETDFLRAGQEELHASLAAAGIPHDYRVNAGGHSDAYWAAHLPEYLDWHLAAWPRDRSAYPECG